MLNIYFYSTRVEFCPFGFYMNFSLCTYLRKYYTITDQVRERVFFGGHLNLGHV